MALQKPQVNGNRNRLIVVIKLNNRQKHK